MYINDRDQINYHGFLKALREMQGANLKQVSEGICSESEISRMEIGDRLPEKLMRDRVTSRLGVSGEEYEEYLRPEEYRQWEIRMYILDNINKGDAEAVERGIAEFDRILDKNPVQEQFADTMRFMLANMKGASEDVLRAYAELAVVHTVPDIDAAFCGAHLLADQELNLIIEYTRLREYYGNPEDEIEWRLLEYEKILSYADKSYMDTIGKSKIYPKTTYFICKWVLTHEENNKYLQRALELCSKSIELLRDASRLYYFVELLECRKEIITRLLDCKVADDAKVDEWKTLYDKDSEWEMLFKELYSEYNVPVYMQNFTYLYVETECNSAVEVIRTRRNMLRLSRVKVSDNICDEKTVERFENYANSPSIVVVRDIFERIGLCAEYKRARVVTDNAEMLKVVNELERCSNSWNSEASYNCINILTNNLHMDISYNMQAVERIRNLLEIRENKREKNELYKKALNTLEYTIPFGDVIRKEKIYLTRAEVFCVYDLAFKVDGEVSAKCLDIIWKMCNENVNKNINATELCIYEVLMGELASYLGDKGRYEESLLFSEKIMKECLTHRKQSVLVDNIYNKLWNYEKQIKEENKSEKIIIQKELYKGILLAELNRKNNWVAFLQNKSKNKF